MTFVGSAIAAAITFVGIVIVDKTMQRATTRKERQVFERMCDQ